MRFELLKQHDFRVFWLGQLASIFGTRFSGLAIPWIVLHTTGSPLQAAIVAICGQVMPFLLALPAGVWIERNRKRPIALVSEGVNVLAMSGLAVAAWQGWLTTWFIALILLLTGVAGLLFRVSISPMLPGMVGRENLIHAHNYLEGADALATLTGPTLAGITFATLGAAWALGIDAFTFLLSFTGIALLRYQEPLANPRPATEETGKARGLREAFQGFRYLVSNGVQRLVTFSHIVLGFCTNAVTLLVIVLAQQELALDTVQTGLLFSAAGLGNVAGVFLLNRLTHLRWGALFGGILTCSGIGVLLLVTADSLMAALIGMFLFDGALSMGFVINGAARQAITPDRLLARVGSAGFVFGGLVGMFSNAYAGGVAQWFGARTALVFCAILLFTGAACALWNRATKRSIKDVQPIELEA